MGYHDRDTFERRWATTDAKKEKTENPRIKLISPQKKLIDIQEILNKARLKPMTMYELHTAIQGILDDE